MIEGITKPASESSIDPVDTIISSLSPCTFAPFKDTPRGWTPPGNLVLQYNPPMSFAGNRSPISSSSEDTTVVYEIYHESLANHRMRLYHHQLQIMPFFFIDTASFIDPCSRDSVEKDTSTPDTQWEIFIIFQKTTRREITHYSIVGYTTVYRFFRFPDNYRFRISQFLIFEPYHRQGHGTFLLASVYKKALSSGVIDTTLELQSPDFKIMRTVTDIMLLSKLGVLTSKPIPFAKPSDPVETAYSLPSILPFSPDLLESAQKIVPLSTNQLKHCYNIIRMICLPGDAKSEEEFRKDIKRHLLRTHEEELVGLAQEERISKLSLLYQMTLAEYKLVLASFKKHMDLLSCESFGSF
eukprot:MONOS_2694.1-p1 / transcript=MONOS_2694.1 / gene=MONOS_2694 / organism=Monocercomonoides_exilis_PA203 / gene_product=histone acetyltransferase type b catalytic subunit / transcript_product=histone acetyltransferase type b catalytic subunit / location=Mono_scaffold00056:157480-159086(+) / protein_length=353 / sequence_SO=supercontig / SO=protein_coding / is_pseudo=false